MHSRSDSIIFIKCDVAVLNHLICSVIIIQTWHSIKVACSKILVNIPWFDMLSNVIPVEINTVQISNYYIVKHLH